MTRGFWCAAAFLFVQTSYAGLFYREFNLRDNHEQYLIEVSNAEVYQGDYTYWRPILPNIEAQVIYKFDVNSSIEWGLLYANYNTSAIQQDPFAYIFVEASSDGINWRTFNSYIIGKKPNTFVKDISSVLFLQEDIYVRARFSGSRMTENGLVYTQYLTTDHSDNPSFFVRASTISPEPSCCVMLLILMLLTPLIRVRV